MPTYEYECQACSLRFENFQSMSSPVITECPECKKNQVQRLISGGIGVIYKGSGFSRTDYRQPHPTSKISKKSPFPKKRS